MKKGIEDEGDSINRSIEALDEFETSETSTAETSLPDAIREINKTLFKDNPLKTANLTYENRKGMTQIIVLNDFMSETYGIRFSTLDTLTIDTMNRGMSVNAFGIAAFNDALKSIQASFQNVGDQSALKRVLGR